METVEKCKDVFLIFSNRGRMAILGVAGLLPKASQSSDGIQNRISYVNSIPFNLTIGNSGSDKLFRLMRYNEAYLTIARIWLAGQYTVSYTTNIIVHDKFVDVSSSNPEYYNIYRDDTYIYLYVKYAKFGDWSRGTCEFVSHSTYLVDIADVTDSVSIDSLTKIV